MADELRSKKVQDDLDAAEKARAETVEATQTRSQKEHNEVDAKTEERLTKLQDKNARALNAAAASGDARVQNLLGQRVVAVQNADEEQVKEIDEKIANLV